MFDESDYTEQTIVACKLALIESHEAMNHMLFHLNAIRSAGRPDWAIIPHIARIVLEHNGYDSTGDGYDYSRLFSLASMYVAALIEMTRFNSGERLPDPAAFTADPLDHTADWTMGHGDE